MRILSIVFILLILLASYGQCVGTLDYKAVTKECIIAYKNHSFGKAIKYRGDKRIYNFTGCAGCVGCSDDVDNFSCKYSIKVRMDFSNKKVVGEYLYVLNKRNRIRFTGSIDGDNNIMLKEIIDENIIGYRFKGTFLKGVIKGLWSKGEEKKQFSFYVKDDAASNNSP